MNGLAFDVQGRAAGRGEDGNPFFCRRPEMAQERGFARSGLPRDEHVSPRTLHQVQGVPELIVDLDFFITDHLAISRESGNVAPLYYRRISPGIVSDFLWFPQRPASIANSFRMASTMGPKLRPQRCPL